MRPRAILLVLLAVAAPALAGDGAIETDPFLAALAGKSGPDAVAAPSFDPDLAALSWTTRPRREIVDVLAARLLRGEAKGWTEPAKETPSLPAPPSRIPEDFEAGKFEVADRLAARVPADTAVAFFGSLKEAEDAVDGLSKFLPEALPELCGDPPGGKREALRRAVEMLLLPTIWRSNPGVRTGTRQIAVVASDPDLRWAPDIALVAEVDDASLVRFHRKSTLSFEDRGGRRLRVDGLDVTADDGSVRSFFALEGDVAVWATTKSLRDRVVAAAAGKAPTLLSPDPRAYALARRTFPAKEGGALLVVPDAFLARVNAAEFRGRRAAALRCEAARLLLDAGRLAGKKDPGSGPMHFECPVGGQVTPRVGVRASFCSVHGSAGYPTAIDSSAVMEKAHSGWRFASRPSEVQAPVATRWGDKGIDLLIPSGSTGETFVRWLLPAPGDAKEGPDVQRVLGRVNDLLQRGTPETEVATTYESLVGLRPQHPFGLELTFLKDRPAQWSGHPKVRHLTIEGDSLAQVSKGILRLSRIHESMDTTGAMSHFFQSLRIEWR